MHSASGKVALITGASRGIGAGLAATFAGYGLRLGLCARHRPDQPAEAADCIAAAVDVSDTEALASFVTEVENAFGGIDLWVNNAAVLEPIGPLRELSLAAFRRLIEINIMGVVNASQQYIRHRHRHGGGGVLINISSGAGQHAYAGWSAYCASKAAVDRFSEALSLEEAGQGLQVYAVAPGVVDTSMQATIRGVDADQFPAVAKFRNLKKHNQFNTPDFVAQHLLAYAFDPARKPAGVIVRVPNQWQTG